MFSKRLILILLLLGLKACASAQPLPPATAQAAIRTAWQADQHIVWDIDWPAAPLGGPVTVETWRADQRYRFEILEAKAPGLVGETLIFDGQQAWRYNRFDLERAPRPALPVLSPVTDAFAIIEELLATPPKAASRQEGIWIDHGPGNKIILTFDDNANLTLWRDRQTGLPARITFSIRGQQAELRARRLEPLTDPPAALFKPDDFTADD